MNDFLNSLPDTWMGRFAVENFWAWPLLENLHFVGLCALVGGLLVIDLRVIGIGPPKNIPIKPAMNLIPFVMIAFSINLVTGLFFVCANPSYFDNIAFQWKCALMVLAGANALWFWFGEHTKLSNLPDGVDTPMSAKVIAAGSLALWAGVIVLGRLLPYF